MVLCDSGSLSKVLFCANPLLIPTQDHMPCYPKIPNSASPQVKIPSQFARPIINWTIGKKSIGNSPLTLSFAPSARLSINSISIRCFKAIPSSTVPYFFKIFEKILACPNCLISFILTHFRVKGCEIMVNQGQIAANFFQSRCSEETFCDKILARWIFRLTIPACSSNHATKNRTAKSSPTGRWWNRIAPPMGRVNASSLISVS